MDGVILYPAVGAALQLRFGGAVPPGDWSEIRTLLPLLVLARLGSFYAAGIYRRSFVFPRGFDYADLIQAWASGTVILVAAVFFGRMLETSRLFLVYEAILFLALASCWRSLFGGAVRAFARTKEATFVGDPRNAERINHFLNEEGWEYKITKIVSAGDEIGETDAIFVEWDDYPKVLAAAGDRRILVLPNTTALLLTGATPLDLGGCVILDSTGVRKDRHYLAAKRAMDVTVAGAGLIAFSPVLLCVAVLVRLTSRGPAFFRQKRIGQGGRTFQMHKFRTMTVGAEGPLLTEKNDPRVTGIGKFLRRWSIDELPQLLNVLGGSMSLVGPRPELPEIVAAWPEWRRHILDAAPGITGLVQVLGRDELSDDEKAKLDLYYAMNRSFEMDVSIILRTFRAVFRYGGRA